MSEAIDCAQTAVTSSGLPPAKKFYVYLHLLPEGAAPERKGPDRVFYVGKGSNHRREHRWAPRHSTYEGRSEFWKRTVAKYGGFEIQLALETDIEAESFLKEVELIALYGRRDIGRGPLVNLTDGGEGQTGILVSQETKKKASLARKGKPRPDWVIEKLRVSCGVGTTSAKRSQDRMFGNSLFAGRKHGLLAREAIRVAQTGRRHNPEAKRKMSVAKAGKRLPPAHCENIAKALTGRPVSLSTRDKISSAALARYATGWRWNHLKTPPI